MSKVILRIKSFTVASGLSSEKTSSQNAPHTSFKEVGRLKTLNGKIIKFEILYIKRSVRLQITSVVDLETILAEGPLAGRGVCGGARGCQ